MDYLRAIAEFLDNKSVALTDKCVQKVHASWLNREHWQWRHYAAHIGLLFWAWGILELPIAEYFTVLRFNSYFIPSVFTKNAHWSLASSMIFEVGLPAP